MTDQRIDFLHNALSYAAESRITSEYNPFTFATGNERYCAHVSLVHDSGEGRDNDDEQRIQVPRAVLEEQNSYMNNGYNPLFLGFFSEGSVFTDWEPEYLLSQNPERNGSVYARLSHKNIALTQGVAVRSVNSPNLGRHTSVITLPIERFPSYLNVFRVVHRTSILREIVKMLNSG